MIHERLSQTEEADAAQIGKLIHYPAEIFEGQIAELGLKIKVGIVVLSAIK